MLEISSQTPDSKRYSLAKPRLWRIESKFNPLTRVIKEGYAALTCFSLKQLGFDDYWSLWRSGFIFPELLSVLLLAGIWQKVWLELNLIQFKGVWLFLIVVFLIRLIWNTAILIHGFGHSIVRTLVDRKLDALHFSAILEQRHPIAIIQSLLPFSPIFVPFFKQPSSLWVEVGDRTPWKVRLKASGGLLGNLIALSLGLLYFWQPGTSWESTSELMVFLIVKCSGIAFIVANLVILLSSQSDLVAIVTGNTDRFYCGNFGLIGCQQSVEAHELLPRHLIGLFKTMGYETEIRGMQAGGGFTLAYDKAGHIVFVGHKMVNTKRGHLTHTLESAFSRTRRRAVKTGIKPIESTVIGAWHYRFGTSGPPSVLETHWHEWTPARIEPVWQIENGQWTCRSRNINHRITHNGDFNAWKIFGQEVDYISLGLWLERVLHTPNRTVGDSPKIAGTMDLLIAQGMWTASVRLAYQLTIAVTLEDAFGGHPPAKDAPFTAPTKVDLNDWAGIFEAVFVAYVSDLSDPHSIFIPDIQDRLKQQIVDKLMQARRLRHLTKQQLTNFARVAVEAFLYNDVYRATQFFMSRAQGSFGLVIISTLAADRLVLSALGQSIAIGFDWQNRYAIYASEPAAVDAALSGRSGTYRLDLNQNAGEIAVLGATDLIVYSMTENRELQNTELMQRGFSPQEHPYIQTSSRPSTDPIESDLRDIPQILSKIQNTWMDPTSLNRQSAEYLLNFLIAKARYLTEKQEKLITLGMDPTLAKSRHVDVLITGVENSLWLGEQFAQDLRAVFPLLSIQTLSSNQVLKDLQYNFENLHLARQSIVFAISQSGQTFPTRQVLHAFDLLVRQNIIREFFVLTGEPTSFSGSPLAQSTFPGEPFSRRIFTNGSGRRMAEPTTASVAATHQTLTELLFYLARKMHLAIPNGHPLGLTLSSEKFLVLEQMDNEFLHQSVPDILGITATGQVQRSRLHQQLIQGGRRWALHITETPWAWGIHAMYVLITVGWAIPFGYTIPIIQTLFKGILLANHISQDALIARIFAPWVVLVDIAIYIFGAWIWALGLRLIQKRQLLARTGKRTLVIGDIPWVHQILTTYVSKLFSLSYGITSLEVHGANPQDHLLHLFSHRVVRGTLLFLGVPDGRFGRQLQSEENAVFMTGRQANGIQSLGIGPEIVAVGTNLSIGQQGFTTTMVLPSSTPTAHEQIGNPPLTDNVIENLRESRFDSFRRLLASYVFFWALAKRVANFPFLKYAFWKSQSRTKIMTTAAPVSAIHLDRPEQEEISILGLDLVATREQS